MDAVADGDLLEDEGGVRAREFGDRWGVLVRFVVGERGKDLPPEVGRVAATTALHLVVGAASTADARVAARRKVLQSMLAVDGVYLMLVGNEGSLSLGKPVTVKI